jgi:hypothetical protein
MKINDLQSQKARNKKNVMNKKERKLTNEEMLKIVDAITPIYKEGQRHTVAMYLTGWLYKAHVSYESAKELIELICNKFTDGECNDRLYTLDRTYGLKGTQPSEYRLKTKSGIFELLRNWLNKEEAIKRVKMLEEIFETASPKDTLRSLAPSRGREVR